MKIKSYKFLFCFFSFLSDKTNGFPLFVKLKLALGTLILGLTISSCGGKSDKDSGTIACYVPVYANEEEPLRGNMWPPPPPDSTDAMPLILVMHPKPATPPKLIKVSTAIPSEPEVTCYDPIAPYDIVRYPQFNEEGERGLLKWMEEHLKFPEEFKEKNSNGKIVVNLLIDEEGKVIEVQQMKGLDNPEDTETGFKYIEELFLSSPAWIPGIQDGEPAKMTYTVPVSISSF